MTVNAVEAQAGVAGYKRSKKNTEKYLQDLLTTSKERRKRLPRPKLSQVAIIETVCLQVS
jgi:hypothetical protein